MNKQRYHLFRMTIILFFLSAGPVHFGLCEEQPQPATPKPTLYIIGDSTVHNSQSGLMGWGDAIGEYFDSSLISIRNCARGGRSSRTFYTEGLWQKVLDDLKPGDVVLMQFGHNDGGSLNTGRARASLKGIGDQTEEVIMESTGRKETVHTYGWYLKKYIADAKTKGAVPIVLSPIPRNVWNNGKIERASNDYGKWAAQTAQAADSLFIDLNALVADEYDQKHTEDDLKQSYFPVDHTHTSPAGAKRNAQILRTAIKRANNCQLAKYIAEN